MPFVKEIRSKYYYWNQKGTHNDFYMAMYFKETQHLKALKSKYHLWNLILVPPPAIKQRCKAKVLSVVTYPVLLWRQRKMKGQYLTLPKRCKSLSEGSSSPHTRGRNVSWVPDPAMQFSTWGHSSRKVLSRHQWLCGSSEERRFLSRWGKKWNLQSRSIWCWKTATQ